MVGRNSDSPTRRSHSPPEMRRRSRSPVHRNRDYESRSNRDHYDSRGDRDYDSHSRSDRDRDYDSHSRGDRRSREEDEEFDSRISHDSIRIQEYSSSTTTPAYEQPNQFVNDGSFMEMFKRRQDEAQRAEQELKQEEENKQATKKSLLHRKIPQKKKRVLSGNSKPKEQLKAAPSNSAWEAYMREVEAYKSKSCADDDRFSRPLCK